MAAFGRGHRGAGGRAAPTPAILADRCAQAVMETVPQVMRAIREEMRRQGSPLLSIPQLRALSYLHRQPGAYLSRLAEHLGVTRPTASSLVERLVRRGMVARITDPEERRRVVLTLTPFGVRHLRRTRESAQAWMATLLAPLSPARLRRIAQGLNWLGEPFNGTAGKGAGRQEVRPRPRTATPIGSSHGQSVGIHHGWQDAAARTRPTRPAVDRQGEHEWT